MTALSALEGVFLGSLEKPAAERDAFLDQACHDNPDLRARVDRLLAAHARAVAILEPSPTGPYANPPADSPPVDQEASENRIPHLGVGTVLAGKYKLLEEIGEGGMGSVWMAQQTEPIKRPVAVKVIKAGMDSKTVLARFDAERQALALMDHPNIARVFDAGSTSDGRPFFVMELVRGVPITQFCDAHKLTPRGRLELFVPVCQAIQHAHQKGVIHRDIKPRNVLVALYDDHPVPKVIDFGVAKATSQPLTEQTLSTGFGTVVGTPEYMSPEQATFNNLDIDTRSDVYSLGVLLYELLTGSPPISRRQLEKAGLLEMLRMVREDEPPRPSTMLSTADTLQSLAANRGMEPRKLTGLYRNELDWIVMKALEKDRRRRYETANGFAADVLRFLSGEPVQAVPPSAGYRMRKFVRKHQGPVMGAVAVVTVLILGMTGTMWGLLRAEQAKTAEANQSRIANELEAARLRAEAKVALQDQSEQLRQVRNRDAAFGLLSQVENALRIGDATRAGEALEQTQKRIAEGGADDLKEKLTRCGIELATLRELNRIDNDRWTVVEGKYLSGPEIAARLDKAFAGLGFLPGITPPKEAAKRIIDSLVRERLLTSLEVWFVLSGANPALRDLLTVADPDEFRNEARRTNYALTLLARVFRGKTLPLSQPVWFATGHGENPRMDRNPREQLLLDALRARPNSFPILMALGQLDQNNDKDSAPRRAGWYRAALAAYPASAVAWNNLGSALYDLGDTAGAIAAHNEAILRDPKYAPAYYDLGVTLRHSGDTHGAIAAYKEAIRLDPELIPAYNNLGNALLATGDTLGAMAMHREIIRLDPKYVQAHFNLGAILYGRGDRPGAIAEYKEAIRLDPNYAHAHYNLGIALRDMGNSSGAIASFKEAVRANPKYASAHNNLGNSLLALGDLSNAIASYKEAIRLDPKLARAHTNLGAIYLLQKKYVEAIACAREAIHLDPKFPNSYAMLGDALMQSGDVPGARAAWTEAARLDPKRWGPLLAKLPPIPVAPPPREVNP